MELPKTLVNLLGCLVTENGLLSWQIFDEKSSHVIVKIRFGNGHCGPTTEKKSTETVTAYRRKPPSQVKRDQARVAAHKRQQSTAPRVQTRSMAAACLPTEPREGDQKTHDSDNGDSELSRYVEPQREHILNPLVLPFESPRNTHDASLLSRGNESESPCNGILRNSQIPSTSLDDDVPLAMVTPPVLPSTMNALQPPAAGGSYVMPSDDSDVVVGSAECEHSPSMMDSSEHEISGDDVSIPEMAPYGMEDLLDSLRKEIRSIIRPPHL